MVEVLGAILKALQVVIPLIHLHGLENQSFRNIGEVPLLQPLEILKDAPNFGLYISVEVIVKDLDNQDGLRSLAEDVSSVEVGDLP